MEQGAVVGGYKIIDKVGEGGLSVVYKTKHLLLDRDAALKVLKPNLGRRHVQRFLQGTKAAATLKHLNIALIYSTGTHEGTHYVAEEYVEGKSLRDIIYEPGFNYQYGISLLLAVLSALEYAHKNGVAHCDIKPLNVQLDKDATPHIIDFDFGGMLTDSLDEKFKVYVFGTVGYIAPERFIWGMKTDARADLFSVGAVLYEMLTHKLPYEKDGTFSVAITEDLINPRSINPEVPESLDQLCMKALETDREKRFQTAEEFSAALAGFSK